MLHVTAFFAQHFCLKWKGGSRGPPHKLCTRAPKNLATSLFSADTLECFSLELLIANKRIMHEDCVPGSQPDVTLGLLCLRMSDLDCRIV